MSVWVCSEENRYEGNSQWVLGKASVNKLICGLYQTVRGSVTRYAPGVVRAIKSTRKKICDAYNPRLSEIFFKQRTSMNRRLIDCGMKCLILSFMARFLRFSLQQNRHKRLRDRQQANDSNEYRHEEGDPCCPSPAEVGLCYELSYYWSSDC
jgi:hypothetical protein